MECRNFEITLMSANDLEDVRLLGKMQVHARVSVGGGGLEGEKRTPTDTHGKINPAWNFRTRYIGEVNTPMKDLFDVSKATGGSGIMCYPVMKGSVTSKGVLNFSYNFGEKVMIDQLLLAQAINPGGAVADLLRAACGKPTPPPPPKKC